MAAEKSSSSDMVMWILAALVLGGGLYGFVYFEGQAMTLIRVVGLVAAVGVALAIASRTTKGREGFSYVREVDVERRKVVWPTRQETVQTTLIVVVFVLLVALMLWGLDSLLGWLVSLAIG